MRRGSPLERARRAQDRAALALTGSTTVTILLGVAVVVSRVREGPGVTPLAWALVAALTAFLGTIVWHYLATDHLDWVTHLIKVTCRRAVNAGLTGDRTTEQEAWHAVNILTGKAEQ